jgi:hypothetical protein
MNYNKFVELLKEGSIKVDSDELDNIIEWSFMECEGDYSFNNWLWKKFDSDEEWNKMYYIYDIPKEKLDREYKDIEEYEEDMKGYKLIKNRDMVKLYINLLNIINNKIFGNSEKFEDDSWKGYLNMGEEEFNNMVLSKRGINVILW